MKQWWDYLWFSVVAVAILAIFTQAGKIIRAFIKIIGGKDGVIQWTELLPVINVLYLGGVLLATYLTEKSLYSDSVVIALIAGTWGQSMVVAFLRFYIAQNENTKEEDDPLPDGDEFV